MRSWLAVGLVVSLDVAVVTASVMVPRAAVAAPGALDRAEAHRGAGEHGKAADAFVEYYDGLPEDMQSDETGEFVVLEAAKAYDIAFDATGDVALLERSRDALDRYLTAIEARHGADNPLAEAARTQREAVQAKIDEATEPEPEPEPPEPEPRARARARTRTGAGAPTRTSDDRARTDRSTARQAGARPARDRIARRRNGHDRRRGRLARPRLRAARALRDEDRGERQFGRTGRRPSRTGGHPSAMAWPAAALSSLRSASAGSSGGAIRVTRSRKGSQALQLGPRMVDGSFGLSVGGRF